jgi:hypothetical protein
VYGSGCGCCGCGVLFVIFVFGFFDLAFVFSSLGWISDQLHVHVVVVILFPLPIAERLRDWKDNDEEEKYEILTANGCHVSIHWIDFDERSTCCSQKQEQDRSSGGGGR